MAGKEQAQNGTNSGGEINRVFVWIHPRSVSTALTKCIAHVPGVQIWQEPYASCYFNKIFTTKMDRFPLMMPTLQQFAIARKELDDAKGKHKLDGGKLLHGDTYNLDWVKGRLEAPLDEGKNFLFCKDASFGIDFYYDKLPEKVTFQHTFLIRDPRKLAVSGGRLLKKMFRDDSDDFDMYFDHCYKGWEELSDDTLYDLYQHVRKSTGVEPTIIDADDLVTYPEKILPKYFERIGLKYDPKYLKWDPKIDILKTYYASQDQLVWGFNEGVYNTAFYSSEFLKNTSGPPKWKDMHSGEVKYASDLADGYKVMYDNRIKPF